MQEKGKGPEGLPVEPVFLTAKPIDRVFPIPRLATVTMVAFPSTEKLGRVMISPIDK